MMDAVVGAVIGALSIMVVLGGGLIRHVMEDAKYRQKVDALEERLAALDDPLRR